MRCAMFCAASAPASPSRARAWFDVLAARRECHHLLARIPIKLPPAIGTGNLNSVSKLLPLAGQFCGAVHCAGEALSTIDLYRVEPAPFSVRAAGHVGDDDVGMEMRVGSVAVISAIGWTGGDVIEASSDDIGGHDRFAAAALTRERILLKFSERAADRVVMSRGEPLRSPPTSAWTLMDLGTLKVASQPARRSA